MKRLLYYAIAVLFFACSGSQNKNLDKVVLNEGKWRMLIKLSSEDRLPIDFILVKNSGSYTLEFINASERILFTDVKITDQKITITHPVYDSWFEGEILGETKIKGFWFKAKRDYKIAFEANYEDKKRFQRSNSASQTVSDVSGNWEVDFSKSSEDHYKALGIFKQEKEKLTGTFLTETGDYRFLQGNMYGNEFAMSCFDGSHAFLFKAILGDDDTLRGKFLSGNHWEEPWVAVRNESFKLTDPDSLTYLKKGYDKLAFTFPDIDGNNVSLSDEKYQNKVVIVNIMGPWCPNCKDETAYLAELYNRKKTDGLEIIALSFDRMEDMEKCRANLKKIKNHFNAKYDFLLAGTIDKKEAAKKLPMLNHIMSYPTSIFIDRQGVIRKIRTGFYGPGTGEHYIRYIEQTNDFVDKLLN